MNGLLNLLHTARETALSWPLPWGHPLTVLALVSAHAAAASLVALILCRMLPERYRGQRADGFIVLFTFGFSTFFLGYISVIPVFILLSRQRPSRLVPAESISTADIMEEDLRLGDRRFGEGAFTRILETKEAPVELKQRVFTGLSGFGRPDAFRIIKAGLSNPADEVRLYAFGIMSNVEKQYTDRIHALKEALKAEKSGYKRAEIQKELAQAYHDLVYFNIVDEAVREAALDEAIRWAELSLRESPSDSATYVLLGKACLKKNLHDKALSYLEKARELDAPAARTIPYLAEIYFRRKDYKAVKELFSHMETAAVFSNQLKDIIEIWKGTGQRTSTFS